MDADGPDRLRTAADARARFLARDGAAGSSGVRDGAAGSAGVRDVVAASWRRSRSAGVDADAYRTIHHDDVDYDSRLVRCARPVIERLAGEMVDVPVAIALSDARARLVHRLDCATSVARPLDRVDFTAGFSWAEGGVGTNGIGTVLEAGSSVVVVGAEHFTEALVRFACTGAPILDPVTGRVEGVLDVSSLAQDWTPLMHTLVRRAVADIGQELLLDRGRALQALFDAFARADSRTHQAVMAIGESVMVNRRAQQLFTAAEQSAIHQHALFLLRRRDRVREALALDSGRVVRLRATRILAGEDVAGIVLLLDDEPVRPPGPVQEGRAVAGGGAAVAGGRAPDGSRSPGWIAAGRQVDAALAASQRLLVLGEPGTGKATLVVDLFRRAWPGAVVRDGPPLEVARAVAASAEPGGPRLAVLRRLDRLDAAAVEAVGAVLAAAGSGWRIAATADDADVGRGRPFEALLDRFDQSVTVPPLRLRAGDLPGVAARVLAEAAPGRRVALHPEAVRILARQPWPGNVAQLATALRAALARRPVGEIGPEDLPAGCRCAAATRTLSPIEVAERDAIVAALRDSGGNRVRAAAALGMARSSLYRKVRAYGITDA